MRVQTHRDDERMATSSDGPPGTELPESMFDDVNNWRLRWDGRPTLSWAAESGLTVWPC
jgi:hypothetical protein